MKIRNMKYVKVAVTVAALNAALHTTNGAVFFDTATLNAAWAFAQDPRFNCVGTVGLNIGGKWISIGSGEIILDGSWVFCSGHELSWQLHTFSGVRFSLRDSTGAATLRVVADSWYVYPGFDPRFPGGPGDFGLIHLTQPITSVAAASLYTGSQASLNGKTAYMAGFGDPGTAGNGTTLSSNVKYAGQNIIGDCAYPSWVDPNNVIVNFSSPLDSSAQPLEYGASPGDSGGGLFVDDNGLKLAAILSAVTSTSTFNYGDITSAAPISFGIDWINRVTSPTPVPEPPSHLALLMTIGFCLLGKAYRSLRQT